MVSVDSGEEGRYDIPKPPWGALRKNLKREITCSDFNLGSVFWLALSSNQSDNQSFCLRCNYIW